MLNLSKNRASLSPVKLGLAYLSAKEYVIKSGFGSEIDWQEEAVFETTTEDVFMREAAWVVLTAGFRESVVRRVFPDVSSAFLDWMDAKQIASRINACHTAALEVFGNRRKIDAIASIVSYVADQGIDRIKQEIQQRGIDFIQELPFMGPVTAFHLAKNLGLQIVKPDRHLLRVARAVGFGTPADLCAVIADVIGDSLSVVDLVLWRYATLKQDYIDDFRVVLRPSITAERFGDLSTG